MNNLNNRFSLKKIISSLLTIFMVVGCILFSNNEMVSAGNSQGNYYLYLVADKGLYRINDYVTNASTVLTGKEYTDQTDKWSYDLQSKTLTLKDGFEYVTAQGICGLKTDGDVTIIIEGTVNISGADFGIDSIGSTLIKGNGTLNLNSTTNSLNYNAVNEPAALYVSGTLTVAGNVTINATGTYCGIDAAPIIIKEQASIKATGSNAAVLSFNWDLKLDSTTHLYATGNENVNTFTDLTEVSPAMLSDVSDVVTTGQYPDYSPLYHTLKMTGTSKIAKSIMIVAQKYTVTLSADENGSIDKTSVENVSNGTTVNADENKLTIGSTVVTATPNKGYLFDAWTGIPQSGEISEDAEIKATFKKAPVVTYEVIIQAGENGSIDKESIEVVEGTEITTKDNQLIIGDEVITATPNEGYLFDAWTGIPDNGVITEDGVITATFKQKEVIKPVEPEKPNTPVIPDTGAQDTYNYSSTYISILVIGLYTVYKTIKRVKED